MQVVEHVAELNGPIRHVILVLWPLLREQGLQRPSLHVVHDHVEDATLVDQVDDARDRRMVELLDQVGLGDQALCHHLARSGVVGEANLLHGPLLAQRLVHGEPHRGHPAAPDHAQKLVPAANHIRLVRHAAPYPVNAPHGCRRGHADAARIQAFVQALSSVGLTRPTWSEKNHPETIGRRGGACERWPPQGRANYLCA